MARVLDAAPRGDVVVDPMPGLSHDLRSGTELESPLTRGGGFCLIPQGEGLPITGREE